MAASSRNRFRQLRDVGAAAAQKAKEHNAVQAYNNEGLGDNGEVLEDTEKARERQTA